MRDMKRHISWSNRFLRRFLDAIFGFNLRRSEAKEKWLGPKSATSLDMEVADRQHHQNTAWSSSRRIWSPNFGIFSEDLEEIE